MVPAPACGDYGPPSGSSVARGVAEAALAPQISEEALASLMSSEGGNSDVCGRGHGGSADMDAYSGSAGDGDFIPSMEDDISDFGERRDF